jgi:hypothetical protein
MGARGAGTGPSISSTPQTEPRARSTDERASPTGPGALGPLSSLGDEGALQVVTGGGPQVGRQAERAEDVAVGHEGLPASRGSRDRRASASSAGSTSAPGTSGSRAPRPDGFKRFVRGMPPRYGHIRLGRGFRRTGCEHPRADPTEPPEGADT